MLESACCTATEKSLTLRTYEAVAVAARGGLQDGVERPVVDAAVVQPIAISVRVARKSRRHIACRLQYGHDLHRDAAILSRRPLKPVASKSIHPVASE